MVMLPNHPAHSVIIALQAVEQTYTQLSAAHVQLLSNPTAHSVDNLLDSTMQLLNELRRAEQVLATSDNPPNRVMTFIR